MLVRVRSSSRPLQPSGDDMAATACPGRDPRRLLAAGNNSGAQRRQGKPQQRNPAANIRSNIGVSNSAPAARHSHRVCTYSDYVKLRQVALGVGRTSISSWNASDRAADTKTTPMFQSQPLTTFAEYQKRGLRTAEQNQQDSGPLRPSLASSDFSQLDLPEPDLRETSRAANGIVDGSATLAKSTAADENAELIDDEDAGTEGTGAPGRQGGCCACCSRGKRDRKDQAGRRRRRQVDQGGASTSDANRPISQLFDEDTELADVKEMDPTITLMPYVLFESERHKVLYQSVGMDEAEMRKRAIALHANDLYKQMLMRLAMARYLRLIRETVVRTIQSKKVQFFLNNDALAVNLMGIEITAEESKSTGEGGANSPGLSVGDLTFDSQVVELPQSRSTQLIESPDVSRQMFKAAPKFTDVEILELLNAGRILDITGRASLESLISLPVTKVGQRRDS